MAEAEFADVDAFATRANHHRSARERGIATTTERTALLVNEKTMVELDSYLEHNPEISCDFRYVFKFKKRTEQFEKLWQMKISARESLNDWLLVSDISPQVAEICANACSELIENCIKYSQNGEMAVVAILVSHGTISIETINTTEPLHRAELFAGINALIEAHDPKEVFVEKLLNPVEGKSHLGLVKIVVETKGRFSIVPHQDESIIHIKLHMNAK